MTTEHNNYDNDIVVRGAREHNLKGINVDIPRDQITVITGISGSGKSSLAFDTIYAEGQRRYIESLSTYARQFLDQIQKPDVELIEGLPPTIAIEQRTCPPSSRSTVATVTEIYDYLRLLYARIGTPYCYQCKCIISRQTIDQMIQRIMEIPQGTKITLLAPLIKGKKGEHREVFQSIQQKGFVRARVDGELIDLTTIPKLARYKIHKIDVVVDRLIIKNDSKTRLYNSVEICLKIGEGVMFVSQEREKSGADLLFSERYACPACGSGYDELTPRMFSFNSPYGACPGCNGLGNSLDFDPELVVPDKQKSIKEGAIDAWKHWGALTQNHYDNQIKVFSKTFSVPLHKPFGALAKETTDALLFGTKDFEGVIPNLRRIYEKTATERILKRLSSYMSYRSCNTCNGARLRVESLSVKIDHKSIHEIMDLTIEEALEFFITLKLEGNQEIIARPILKEIQNRLRFMMDVGLHYITLGRSSDSLSGGEAQRTRLATQIGSGLVGVCYVLDEPTIGLHPRDSERLLRALKNLRDLGNTVILVEHDEHTIRHADYIIDLGPGAGERGGSIVTCGTLCEITDNPDSLTGQYLNQTVKIELPAKRRRINLRHALEIKGARANNLKDIAVKIPLKIFCCVTGVSGSGKSTLVNDILYRAIYKLLYDSHEVPGEHDTIVGVEHIDKIIEIDQSPIGRTPRSNPATYTKVFDMIRSLFAQTPEAKVRGYNAGRYSFNISGGRCEACTGQGIKKVEMHFLPDMYVLCEECKGKRYNKVTLEVTYKDKSISDVLDMRIEDAHQFFKNISKIERILRTLNDVGLGYIKLGQSSTTLSGGESQRIKLATELSRQETGRTLYILDEPTTGLHFADIQQLLKILHRLVDMGNTVLVIEHNLEVMKTADYIIDLGPEGGSRGGKVVEAGTPEKIAKNKLSYTGRFLRKVL
ncbi:MAG: excinuclease ABC subunit UvrA [Candidatus Brocadia sp.]|nr:UvrABC system protein A [Candidatus Brocadia fulgida]MCC6324980.1 excinuclease ABC subunit UvrA [Candidatus Brocadia sp.]MCE7910708.1 excinuclease ABC subunit UvrA [Candidatus Brocadia sp. AMX3]MDG5996383.1 excinuclease ABC subunit UvrA [Candidatus Brocadia sp.]RIK01995.1 MAG: excinuclease ABC subunit UvrA [Candidatus Brocadia sp.]